MLAAAVYGQPLTRFRTPDYYPAPHQDRLKNLIEAEEFQVKPGGKYLLKLAKIQAFRETGITNAQMIIEAPDCLFEVASGDASSAGPLMINSGDGRLHIEGEGFYSRTTNSTLTISNQVRTTIKLELPGQPLPAADSNATPAPATATNSAATAETVRIQSDHVLLEHKTNVDVITYEGNVRAEDDRMVLTSDRMTIYHLPDGKIDNIEADRHVIIVNKNGGGRATGEHAVFTGAGGRQLVDLTGNPRWEDGPREGSGLVFIFDNINHTLRMEGQAYLKMPPPTNGDSGFLLPPAATRPTNAPAGEVKPVEIYADTMLFQFPPTNGPVQTVLAEGKVLMLDPDQHSRATSDRAFASAITGRLELTGNAIWQADERLARGGLLIFDRERTFHARTNAYLKFPAASLGSLISSGSAGSPDAGARTNQFIEVLADAYDYENDVLAFRDQVHAALVVDGTIRGALDCARLTTTFIGTNQLQSLLAEQDVYARQLPFLDLRGDRLERELKTDRLRARMRTNDLVEEIVAEHHVAGTQTETRAGTNQPVVTTLHTDLFSARFFPTTNRVEFAVAEHDVRLTRDEKTATGNQAVYTASNDVVRLQGNAVVTWPRFDWATEDISVERATGRILGHDDKKNRIKIMVPGAKPKAPKTPDKPAQKTTEKPPQ
jgi:lipopolysaccharide export system protein LptA